MSINLMESSGQRATKEFVIKNNTLLSYNGNDTDVIIPDGVVVIGKAAFKNKSVENVTLPSTVVMISDEAFAFCYALSSITLPDSIVYIGAKAFYEDTGLLSIELPNNLTTLGERAFYKCDQIEEINIPGTLKVVQPMTFYECLLLKYVDIAEGVEVICNGAFYKTAVERIQLPKSTVYAVGKEFLEPYRLNEDSSTNYFNY